MPRFSSVELGRVVDGPPREGAGRSAGEALHVIGGARGLRSPHRCGDERVHQGRGTPVREHPCSREIHGERLPSQIASECGPEVGGLVGPAEYLRSGRHVRAVVQVLVVGEQHRYGRISDIALVDDGCARRLRA
ncbi:hypothetical protein ACFWMQ_11035 [Streptomyces sp. NPDC058372]|uniref:hypothetical protein n=1 Tax=Streptomyces sp. NPDC058372 TaxID=3346464 RepID=UPI00365F36F9